MVVRKNRSDYIFYAVLYTIMGIIAFLTIYPFINVLAISFNSASDTTRGGIYFLPRVFTLKNYEEVFKTGNIPNAFKISILRTLLGTGFGVVCSACLAYTMSRKDFFARRIFGFLLVITMYVSGGMVPDYLLVRDLNLTESFWVYIIPGLVWVWNVIILRSFMDELPYELHESATIDGANDLQVFWKIILPMCVPVLATVALFIAVGQWNSWYDTFLYNSGSEGLSTLQYELMKKLQNSQAAAGDARSTAEMMKHGGLAITPQAIRMTITIIATVPILIVYPFLQRYFVTGMTLGAVKG